MRAALESLVQHCEGVDEHVSQSAELQAQQQTQDSTADQISVHPAQMAGGGGDENAHENVYGPFFFFCELKLQK